LAARKTAAMRASGLSLPRYHAPRMPIPEEPSERPLAIRLFLHSVARRAKEFGYQLQMLGDLLVRDRKSPNEASR
jgi:hypothetical protein